MDRSFLSQPEVIAASRKFVCVRLATYENAAEGQFLASFDVTRSGELENTVFAVLAPDGKTPLARASRMARQTFGTAQRMAASMNRIASQYPATAEAPPALPYVANVRLALDVAACDNQPLVVLFAPDAAVRQTMEERLRPLAWGDRFLGRFVYVTSSDARDLAGIAGWRPEAGVAIVQADRFGLKGKALCQASAAATDLGQALSEGLTRFQPDDKSFTSHVRQGHQSGIFWETVLPVTDKQELQARERGRRQAR